MIRLLFRIFFYFSDQVQCGLCDSLLLIINDTLLSFRWEWVCGFYYLDNETEKYVNEYWHSSPIYVVVKESNLPKGHSLSSCLSQTCLGRENSTAKPSKSMKAHWNFGASNRKISCTIKVRRKLVCTRNDASQHCQKWMLVSNI